MAQEAENMEGFVKWDTTLDTLVNEEVLGFSIRPDLETHACSTHDRAYTTFSLGAQSGMIDCVPSLYRRL